MSAPVPPDYQVADAARAAPRKIVHVDMDAFYASVEQRDHPEWRGRPVIVAWRGMRSVVCAASYEARVFGVRSAMPATRAERLCPDAIFTPPDFPRYRAVSAQIRAIFHRYTDLVEPLSLDEAYLDVTHNKPGLATATAVARQIRADIRAETELNASAGVAPNKFLAKIASDWRKPNGLFVIQPHEIGDFLQPLPVRKLPGVGGATEKALAALGIVTVGELRAHTLAELGARFGKQGKRLYELARGVDERAVSPDQPRRSLSAETTFESDRSLAEVAPALDALAARVWRHVEAADGAEGQAHTVVLKLKTSEFRIITRSHTPPTPPASERELASIAQALLARVELGAHTRYRLAGVGLGNFREAQEFDAQPELF
jgi:DNA polymerase-4